MKKFLTPNEKKIVLFLVSFLIFGVLIINAKKLIPDSETDKNFQDSLETVIKKSNEPFLININSADIETLAELPRIGPAKAKTIYDYRKEYGEFKSLFELMNIKGIGEKTLVKLIPHLEIIGDSTVIQTFVASVQKGGDFPKSKTGPSSEKKININLAGKTEITTLYRIGDVTAKRIMDYRIKNGNFKSIEEIKKVKGIGDGIYEKIKGRITIE